MDKAGEESATDYKIAGLLPHDGKLLVVNREGWRIALLLLLCARCEGQIELIGRSPEKDCR